jgi:hypothetical protein
MLMNWLTPVALLSVLEVELVDTSCVAFCIGSESVLPCICLPLAADSCRYVGSVMWNMLELPMFGQSGNRVCQGIGL